LAANYLSGRMIGFFLFSLFLPSVLFSQTTIFKETIGTYSGTISVTSYTGWSNGNTYTHSIQAGTVVLNSSITPSNYSGASAGTPIRVAGNSTWVISGINTTNCSNITLSFGIHKTNFQHSGSGMIIEVSSDGTNYTQLSWTPLTTGNGTGDNWYYRAGGTNVTGSIPSTNNLRIRFRNTNNNDPYDFDDIELKATVIVPVRFVSVNANRMASTNNIVWKTSDEHNVSHYEVQMSEDGNTFATIGNVSAQNNTSQAQYSFNDQYRSNNKLYYRIVSVDHDGKKTFSRIIPLESQHRNSVLCLVSTTKTGVEISSSASIDKFYTYALMDETGRLIQKGNITSVGSRIRIAIQQANLSGVYFLVLTDDQQVHPFKIVLRQ
jgi:hypothetical protein